MNWLDFGDLPFAKFYEILIFNYLKLKILWNLDILKTQYVFIGSKHLLITYWDLTFNNDLVTFTGQGQGHLKLKIFKKFSKKCWVFPSSYSWHNNIKDTSILLSEDKSIKQIISSFDLVTIGLGIRLTYWNSKKRSLQTVGLFDVAELPSPSYLV